MDEGAVPPAVSAVGAGAGAAGADPTLLEFKDLYLLVKGVPNAGQAKFHPDGFAFKSRRTREVLRMMMTDIASARWKRVGLGHQLRLAHKAGHFVTLEGFEHRRDFDKLQSFFLTRYKTDITVVEPAVVGWNWGRPSLENSSMAFLVDDDPAFELPLATVCQATCERNEATLEFHVDEHVTDDHQGIESIRFFVPPASAADTVAGLRPAEVRGGAPPRPQRGAAHSPAPPSPCTSPLCAMCCRRLQWIAWWASTWP